MGRRKKTLLSGEFCILSCHECYEHAKVLKFADRKKYYKNKLRELTQKFNIKVVDYLIADTQVFLLTSPDSMKVLTDALRWIHGAASCNYNKRTNHCGVCWKPHYDITVVQNSSFLKLILPRIAAETVSITPVKHPAEYNFNGYKELTGIAKRYRIINRNFFINATDFDSFSEFSEWYISAVENTVNNRLTIQNLPENVFAYGCDQFIENIGKVIPKGWYSIKKFNQPDQNLHMIITSKKRKRELLKLLVL